MARKQASPAVRFIVALLIVVAIALVAFFVGYLIGERFLAFVPPVLAGML